jgi:peptide/nickel transport system permease protein
MAKEGFVAGREATFAKAWRRFRRHRLAVFGVIVISVLAVVAILAPVFALQDPYRVDLHSVKVGPSRAHIMGTDFAGRDVWSRLVYGSRVSLSVGLVAVSIYLIIGTILGAISGYYRGVADSLIMRATDVVMCFPTLIIIILLVAVLEPSIYNVMIAIGFLGWPSVCRLVRGQFLSLREKDFVLAAHCLGASDGRIIFRHILPNVVAPLTVAASLGIAGSILLESALSFLGLGVQPPVASWGSMLYQARSTQVLHSMPWIWAPPGLMIFIAVLSINFIGDGLRDALDPWMVIK